jgi:hypothetical protein
MTITLTREEAQQVLDVVERNIVGVPRYRATELLRARLAQPEPEYRDVVIKGDLWRIEFLPDHAASVVLVRANYEAQPEPEPIAYKVGDATVYIKPPIYTAPPQREWQGLTDEEISELIRNTHNTGSFVRAIEAKLKEKNA